MKALTCWDGCWKKWKSNSARRMTVTHLLWLFVLWPSQNRNDVWSAETRGASHGSFLLFMVKIGGFDPHHFEVGHDLFWLREKRSHVHLSAPVKASNFSVKPAAEPELMRICKVKWSSMFLCCLLGGGGTSDMRYRKNVLYIKVIFSEFWKGIVEILELDMYSLTLDE